MASLLKKVFTGDSKKRKKDVVDESSEVKNGAEIAADRKIEQKKVKSVGRKDNDIFKVLVRPLITEKATDLVSLNKYCFMVRLSANKSEVIKKIENLYGVKPIKVNFIKKNGKLVRRGRTFGQKKSEKKAIVTLKAGDKIELYEGV